MTYKDKASYGSLPPCIGARRKWSEEIIRGNDHCHCNTLQHTVTYCNTHPSRAIISMIVSFPRNDCIRRMWNTPHSTLQHTATHCNTLQHTATHCNTQLPRTIICMIALIGNAVQPTAFGVLFNLMLQHTATHCNTPQHTATHCNVLFNLNLQSQSHWFLFKGTWQKRPRELDDRFRSEKEERTLEIHQAVQPIAFGVSFNFNLQSQSPWSPVNGTLQKRPRELESRLRFEIEEITPEMQ